MTVVFCTFSLNQFVCKHIAASLTMINARPLVMTSTDEVPLIYVEIVWYPKISGNEVYIIISYWNLIKQGKCNLEQPINFINDKIKNGYLILEICHLYLFLKLLV